MDILKHLSRREKIILYFTLSIIAINLGFNFIFQPLLGKYKQLNQEALAKRIMLEKANRLINQKETIEEEYNKLSSSFKLSGSPEEQMAKVLSQIESTATKESITISNMRPQPVQDKKFYKRFVVELKCEADLNRLFKFFYELENPASLLKIESLKLNPKAAQPSVFEANILISKLAVP